MRPLLSLCLGLAFQLTQPVAHAQNMTTLALHQAAAGNNSHRIQQLLQNGGASAIDARDAQGRTPLLVATQSNQVAAAKALIEAGADVNAKDNIEDSPYLYAGARGHQEILQMALSHGADLRSTNRYGGTALIPAAERGHVETVRTLINAGVDVNHVNRLGWTALMEAIILSDGGPRHQQILQLLIDAKADVNLADKEGVTPLAHARQRGYSAMVEMLTAAGAR
ncbi:ankyrin repeat domain-containing protein [Comamonas piscis]|uniref:Ankyrin repeat domain-containing protein n=1 Tax=Comamonas piscis TaxID=1562974 RepID=A0A7G5ECD2_9BURK|nr:ankyrin repeat domain-containing protein [Comamonas piscis]